MDKVFDSPDEGQPCYAPCKRKKENQRESKKLDERQAETRGLKEITPGTSQEAQSSKKSARLTPNWRIEKTLR
jgi:hypothetical protein